MIVLFAIIGLLMGAFVNGVSPLNRELFISALKNKVYIGNIVLMSVVFATMYTVYGVSNKMFVGLIIIVLLNIAAVTDLKTKRIPNEIIVLGVIIGLIAKPLNLDVSWLNILITFVVVIAVFGALAFFTKESIGYGDVKLIAMISLFLGWQYLIVVILYSFILSGICSLVLLTFKVVGRKSTIPFAPFLFLGMSVMFIMN